MAIRCHHLGLVAGLSLILSVTAASQLSGPLSASDAAPAQTAVVHTAGETSPVPAPVLFLAGGLLALVAMVRWRQKHAGR